MATESQSVPSLGVRQAVDGRRTTSRADVAPLGPHGPNPLQLHAGELDVLRRLQASGQAAVADDPVWDELEALGFVEVQATALVPGASPLHLGTLTSLGRRYRTD